MKKPDTINTPPDGLLVSVVTPVYNAAPFLRAAFDCLRRQTLQAWEWVVVDDGSTDGSSELLCQFSQSDPRIRLFCQQGYGNAKYARDHAIAESRAPFVVCLDADDQIDDNYLETLLRRQQQTGAMIVYPQLLFTDSPSGNITTTLPEAGFDISQVYEGRQLIAFTVPDWRIGCNGGLYRREVFSRLSYPKRTEPVWMNSDEIDERYYLLAAQRVAFACTNYYYTIHGQSVTKKFSPKLFETLQTDLQLLDLTEKAFGRDSEEFRGGHRIAFNDWRLKQKQLLQHNEQLESAEPLVWQFLQQLFVRLDPRQLTLKERALYLNLFDFRALMFLRGMLVSPAYIVGKMVQRLFPRLYYQHFLRPSQARHQVASLSEAYKQAPSVDDFRPCVVCLFEGFHSGGGLVDRLRGIVSVWQVCKQCGVEFKVHFVHPFRLDSYLVPNAYDWRIGEREITHAAADTKIIVADTLTDEPWERQWLFKQLSSKIPKHAHLQRHLYTNAAFCYDADFRGLFEELFQLEPRLAAAVDAVQRQIGGDYITVSGRFGNLLDDFNEQNYGLPLPPAERQQLLAECEQQTLALHQQHPECKVVVCSDSVTFASSMSRYDFVFVVPGNVTHIDNDRQQSRDYYQKTFVDFFIIARARESYLLRSRGMLFSGFPYAAALLGSRQLKVIDF